MKKRKTFRVWQLTDIDIEYIINKHIELVTTPTQEIVNWDKAFVCTGNPEPAIYRTIKEAKPAPRRSVIYHKYLFLIHLIISESQNSKDGIIHLNYQVLVTVLGKCAGDMLLNLKNMNIISFSKQYIIGKESRAITLLNWNVTHQDLPNLKVIQYSSRLHELLGNKNLNDILQNKFYDDYNNALSNLKLVRKKEALLYLSQYKFKSKQSELFYYSRINNFDGTPSIHSIDKNNRIYHYLTNCPKVLIPYFNIKFEMDISNSHPLLFSYFIIKNYLLINKDNNLSPFSNPKYDLFFNLSLIDLDNSITNNIRYEGQQLRKLLKNRGLIIPRAKDLPNDVLSYIFNTSKGYFWDNFQYLFDGMERSEVKANLFREVFYSHSTTVRNKPFGKEFVRQYPHVWSIIRKLKKEHEKSYLPNSMMHFESKLFKEILIKCYEQNWCAINIHDAIVILETPDNDNCTSQQIEVIMKSVYEKYNLFPHVKVEMNELSKM